MLRERRGLGQRHQAKAAVVGIDDARVPVGFEHDMVVRALAGLGLHRLQHVFAGREHGAVLVNREAAGHAKVHDQRLA